MTRLAYLPALFAALTISGGSTSHAPAPVQAPRPAAVAAPRPNIVWISNEDMSPHLGVYGDTVARTPTLDRLATRIDPVTPARSRPRRCARRAGPPSSRGCIRRRLARSTCAPPRTRCPSCPGPYLAVPPFYVKAFPEYLRAAGYYTSNRAKTDYQFGTPFTIWDDWATRRTGAIAPTSASRSSRCSTSRSRTRARSFRRARRARASRS